MLAVGRIAWLSLVVLCLDGLAGLGLGVLGRASGRSRARGGAVELSTGGAGGCESGEGVWMVIGWRRCVFFTQDIGSGPGVCEFSKKLFSRNFRGILKN